MYTSRDLKYHNIKDIQNCRIHGRTDLTGPAIPLFWNGSGVEVRVSGTELWIDIEVDFNLFEPWVSVELNGAFMSRQMLMPGRQSLCLFRCMTFQDEKTVFFKRELQAMHEDDDCHILVHGFRSDGEFLPVRERSCKLEFIGDSITSGEGSYGAREDLDWLSMYMSSSLNYATMTAKALDAEIRILSQGGFGVFSGWDNDRRHVMPAFYDKICGLAFGESNASIGAAKPYDFNSWKPDAVIVNLGTNDNAAFSSPPFTDPETGETWKMRLKDSFGAGAVFFTGSLNYSAYNKEDVGRIKAAVISFLKDLRKKNPESHLVWTYGMLGGELVIPIAAAVSDYMEETGDLNAGFLELPDTPENELGAHSHPGAEAHRHAARILTGYLKSVLGKG